MYRPTVSQLIDRLERMRDQHGDLEVVGYADALNDEFPEVDAEYSTDTNPPVILLTVDTTG